MTRSSSFSLSVSTVLISSQHHLAERDAGPAGDHLGDGLAVHHRVDQRRFRPGASIKLASPASSAASARGFAASSGQSGLGVLGVVARRRHSGPRPAWPRSFWISSTSFFLLLPALLQFASRSARLGAVFVSAIPHAFLMVGAERRSRVRRMPISTSSDSISRRQSSSGRRRRGLAQARRGHRRCRAG